MSVTDNERDRRTPISSRNEDGSAEGLQSYEQLVSKALGGPISEEQRKKIRLEREAARTAEVCGKCGQQIGPQDTVYIGVVWAGYTLFGSFTRHYGPLCEDYAPKYLKRGHDPFAFREAVADPCDSCSRQVVRHLTGRDFYRRHVFCSERCRWTLYNRERDRRAAVAREKICESCGEKFSTTRSDAKTCSPACRQRAYRDRKEEE